MKNIDSKKLIIVLLLLNYSIRFLAQEQLATSDILKLIVTSNTSLELSFNDSIQKISKTYTLTLTRNNFYFKVNSSQQKNYVFILKRDNKDKYESYRFINKVAKFDINRDSELYICKQGTPNNTIPDLNQLLATITFDIQYTKEAPAVSNKEYNLTDYFEKLADSILFFDPKEILQPPPNVIVHNLYGSERLYIAKKYTDSKNKIKPKVSSRIRPLRFRVGEMVQHLFVNYIGEYKSVEVTQTFKDFNTEDGVTFKNIISGQSGEKPKKPTEDEKPPEKKEGDAISKTDQSSLEKIFCKELRAQSTAYVTSLKKNPGYSFGVKDDYNVFNQQIKNFVNNATDESIKEISAILSQFKASSVTQNTIIANLTYIENYITSLTPEIQIQDADAYELSVILTKPDGTIITPPITYTYPILGGFKIDFSTGVIFSYLTNDKYQIIDTKPMEGTSATESVIPKEIIASTADRMAPSIGILAHAYTRMSPYFNPAISFGFSLDKNSIVNWPVGLSLLIGRKSRLVVTCGVVFGKADRLLSKYSIGKIYDQTELNGVSDGQLVTSVNRAKPFFALSYNFGGANIH